MKKLFITIIIAGHYLLSFDLIDLYKKDIPNVLIEDQSKSHMINIELSKKSKINPEIIYYFIKYLQYSVDPLFSDSARLFLGYAKALENNSTIQRNNWIKKEISILSSSDTDIYIKGKIKRLLKRELKYYAHGEMLLPSLQYNNNEKYYYIVKYYTNNKELEYDSETDYYEISINLEKDIIENINQDLLLELNKIKPSVSTNNFKLFDYWYIIEKGKYKLKYNPYMYFKKAFEARLDIQSLPNWTASIIYNPRATYAQFISSFSHVDDRFIVKEHKYIGSISGSYLGLSLNYSYKINKIISPFSYIKVGSTVSNGKTNDVFDFKGDFSVIGVPGSRYFERIMRWTPLAGHFS